MPILMFPVAAVRRLVEHAKAAPRHRLTIAERREIYGDDVVEPQEREEEKGKAGLWLVKDRGIYLMSNGDPADMGRWKPGQVTPTCRVVYAKTFDPDRDEDVWHRSRDAVGGDDFVEMLPVEMVEPAITEALAGDLVLRLLVSDTEIALVDKPARAKRRMR